MIVDRVAALAGSAPMPAVGVSVFDRESVAVRVVRGVADLTTGRAATDDEWWDLASLTKTLVTLPEVFTLVDDGLLALEQPLAECWPRAAGRPIGGATVADLLSHRAGQPATVPFFRTLAGRRPSSRPRSAPS
jgi:CubicO group peptidase (beta-lactamase class C family)